MKKNLTHQKSAKVKILSPSNKPFSPKAIVFDFEGTLTKSDSDHTTWERLWTQLGYDDNECGKLEQRYAIGEISHEQWCMLTLEKFKDSRLTQEAVRSLGRSIKLIDGFIPAIEQIYAKQIPMYILSGSIWDVVISALGDYKKYFKSIWANTFAYTTDGIVENIFGTRYDFEGKAEFVKLRARELQIDPSEILFVGNSNNDEQVKALSGARTLLVNPHRTRVSKAWDFYIPHMNNLTEILPLINMVDPASDKQVEGKSKADLVVALLKDQGDFDLSRYTVIGGYRRFNHQTQALLRSLAQKIMDTLLGKPFGRQNYLIAAAPGSGKTYFVQEIASSLQGKVRFVEVDLSRDSEEQVKQKLEEVSTGENACLCMIDEIDGAVDAQWPYETIYKRLDLNENPSSKTTTVFTLIGSSGGSIEGLKAAITVRNKGRDLIDRVSEHPEYYIEIPPLEVGDNICVYISKVLEAAHKRGSVLTHLEKMAAFYAAMTLKNPRQIKMLADNAVARVRGSNTVLRYDHHFEPGAAENKLFWAQYPLAVEALSGEEIKIQ